MPTRHWTARAAALFACILPLAISPHLRADAAAQTWYFPHLAIGGGWQTTLTFVNYSPQSVTCVTTFYSDSGAPLQLSFADTSTAVSSRTDVVAAGADIHVETRAASAGNPLSGWARAQCTGPVKASLLYRLYNGAQAQGEAGVNATTAPATEFVSYAQTLTGLAYANPSSSTATLTITALDASGAKLASKTEMLDAGEHAAANIGPLLGLSSFTGSVQLTSNVPILALFINAEAFPVVSSLPPADLPDGTPLAGSASGSTASATTYYFPQLAVGAGWQTILTLVDYSPAAVTCTTSFYSDSGAALEMPFADATGATRTDNLAAGASIHIATNAASTAAAASGWAVAKCSAPVKASLLYRFYANNVAQGEAGVNAMTAPATEFSSFAQTQTGLALANPLLSGSSAAITVTGYDAKGNKVASSVIRLNPGEHTAANIGPLFALSSFTGSVEIRSTAPVIALFINAEAFPVFSSLPPAELPAGTIVIGGAAGNIVDEHVLAQTGLAIGMASTVLQSQLQMLVAFEKNQGICAKLFGGGTGAVQFTTPTVTVFYDNQCTQPFIAANPTVTIGDTQVTVSETATYYGLNGAKLGSLTLSEAIATLTDTQLYGLGVFTPANGAPPVQLGLYCTIANTLPCAGGIAQDFPNLGLAIGAVTPLNLTLGADLLGAPVTFTGGGNPVTGPVGSLTLANPLPTVLVIHGGTTFSAVHATGAAAAFALFPPTPTSWTLTDPAHDEQFDISVVDNATRNLNLTITQTSTGNILAIGGLDQSGTGSITYSDGTTSAITAWTLAN